MQLFKIGVILCTQSVDRILHAEVGLVLGCTLASPGTALIPSLSVRNLVRGSSHAQATTQASRKDLEEALPLIESSSLQATQNNIIRVCEKSFVKCHTWT